MLLQYNPPYTLPWLRRNEVGLVIAPPADAAEAGAAEAGAAEAGADSEPAEEEAEVEGPEMIIDPEEDTSPSD